MVSVRNIIVEALSRATLANRKQGAQPSLVEDAYIRFCGILREYSDNNFITAYRGEVEFDGSTEQIEINGADILPWDEAWKEIEKEMHDTFVYGKPQFSRPEIEKAVKAFGWQELCEVTIKELPVVRAQLRDMYNGICEQSRRSKINSYVMGNGVLIERVNVRRLT